MKRKYYSSIIIILIYYKKYLICFLTKNFLNIVDFFQVSDKYECGFWDENNLVWSTSGCQFVKIEINGMYACKCDHITFFGLIGVKFKFLYNIHLLNFKFNELSKLFLRPIW